MDYVIKKIGYDSYYKGYMDLMKQLTQTNDVTFVEFMEHLDKISGSGNIHIFTIIVNNKIVGSGTIIIENKFTHGLKSVGHIEDVIIDKDCRGMNYGKIMINYLIEFAKLNNCYKVILNCSFELVPFYEKCGFINKNSEMSIYF